MLNRLFGDFLVQSDVIKKEDYDDLLPVPKGTRASTEVIAITLKVLTPAEVNEINSRQVHEEFEENAIDSGLITEDKLEKLAVYQSNHFMAFLQLMINRSLIQYSQIQPLLSDFRQERYTEEQFEALLHDDLEQMVQIFAPVFRGKAKGWLITFIQIAKRMLDRDVYLGKAYVTDNLIVDKSVSQSMVGDCLFRVHLCGQGSTLLSVANYYSHAKYDTVSMDALDCVGEFLNCVNGQYATNVSYNDLDIDLNSPEYSETPVILQNKEIFVVPIYVNGAEIVVAYELYP